MNWKIFLLTFYIFFQVAHGKSWIPPLTTAAEMRNPYTWYWPYAIATTDAYRQWFIDAQQITNQLYTQAYLTNAFWWLRGGGGGGQEAGSLGGGQGAGGLGGGQGAGGFGV